MTSVTMVGPITCCLCGTFSPCSQLAWSYRSSGHLKGDRPWSRYQHKLPGSIQAPYFCRWRRSAVSCPTLHQSNIEQAIRPGILGSWDSATPSCPAWFVSAGNYRLAGGGSIAIAHSCRLARYDRRHDPAIRPGDRLGGGLRPASSPTQHAAWGDLAADARAAAGGRRAYDVSCANPGSYGGSRDQHGRPCQRADHAGAGGQLRGSDAEAGRW